MASHDLSVRPLEPAQTDRLADTLSRAFHNDPMYRYITPDETRRPERLRWFFRAMIGGGLSFGRVDSAADVSGGALWLPPGGTSIGLTELVRTGLILAPLRLGVVGTGRFLAVLTAFEQAHERLAPGDHWYLVLLGVNPARQGQGIGSALLRPVLEQADAHGQVCYLETLTARNLPLYQRHGFELAAEGQAGRDRLTFWSMLRRPIAR